MVHGKLADIPAEAQQFLDKEANGLVEYKIDLDYNYWTAGKRCYFFDFCQD